MSLTEQRLSLLHCIKIQSIHWSPGYSRGPPPCPNDSHYQAITVELCISSGSQPPRSRERFLVFQNDGRMDGGYFQMGDGLFVILLFRIFFISFKDMIIDIYIIVYCGFIFFYFTLPPKIIQLDSYSIVSDKLKPLALEIFVYRSTLLILPPRIWHFRIRSWANRYQPKLMKHAGWDGLILREIPLKEAMF